MSDFTLGEVNRQGKATKKMIEDHIEFCEGQHRLTTEGFHAVQLTLAANQAAREEKTKAHENRAVEEQARSRRTAIYIALASLCLGALGLINIFKDVI